jgi:hypothetical protein
MQVTGTGADLQQLCPRDVAAAQPRDQLALGPLEAEQAKAPSGPVRKTGEEAAGVGIDGSTAVHPFLR